MFWLEKDEDDGTAVIEKDIIYIVDKIVTFSFVYFVKKRKKIIIMSCALGLSSKKEHFILLIIDI
jgi:hypothetical protein